MHLWDNMARFGLYLLPCFPMFLKIFRGFCKWFRDVKDELAEYFKTLAWTNLRNHPYCENTASGLMAMEYAAYCVQGVQTSSRDVSQSLGPHPRLLEQDEGWDASG